MASVYLNFSEICHLKLFWHEISLFLPRWGLSDFRKFLVRDARLHLLDMWDNNNNNAGEERREKYVAFLQHIGINDVPRREHRAVMRSMRSIMGDRLRDNGAPSEIYQLGSGQARNMKGVMRWLFNRSKMFFKVELQQIYREASEQINERQRKHRKAVIRKNRNKIAHNDDVTVPESHECCDDDVTVPESHECFDDDVTVPESHDCFDDDVNNPEFYESEFPIF